MVIDVSLLKMVYQISFFLVLWAYSGYAIVMYALVMHKKNGLAIKANYKKIPLTIIVPTFNEQEVVSKKLENLMQLSYPRDFFEIMIADGGSTDNTKEIVEQYALKNPDIHLFSSDERYGKIYDINNCLTKAKGEIIVISDADSILSKNAVEVIANKMSCKENVGAVGLCTIPQEDICSPAELEYWVLNNKLKFLETELDSAHCLIATCYGFKKELIKQFPDDVIADDLYTALKVREAGYRAIYTPDAVAYEVRTPKAVSIMVKHKLRKALAYIREFMRFGYKLIGGSAFGAIIYPTKLVQFFLAPTAALLFTVVSIYFLINGFILWFLLPVLLLGFCMLLSSFVFSHTYHPPVNQNENKLKMFLQQVLAIIVSNITLIAACILYPIMQRSSKYERI